MSEPTEPGASTAPVTGAGATDALAFDVDEEAHRCPYCDAPFRTEHLLHLHLGDDHWTELTEAQREAVELARDEEDDALFVFHIKVLAAITLLMFVFTYTYAFVWT